MEIRKRRSSEISTQQANRRLLLKTIKFYLVLFSAPGSEALTPALLFPRRGRALAASTSPQGDLLPLLQSPSSQSRLVSGDSPLPPGSDTAAGRKHFTPAQSTSSGTELPWLPHVSGKLSLISFLLLRTLLVVGSSAAPTVARQGACWAPGMTPSFLSTPPLPG